MCSVVRLAGTTVICEIFKIELKDIEINQLQKMYL